MMLVGGKSETRIRQLVRLRLQNSKLDKSAPNFDPNYRLLRSGYKIREKSPMRPISVHNPSVSIIRQDTEIK